MAKESNFKNMTLCMFVICFAASALLSVVYVITKDPIEQANIAKTNSSIAIVVPEFDNRPSEEMFTVNVAGKEVNVYPAVKDGKTVGYAIESSSNKGFGGKMTIMVGFSEDGKIYNTSVISHAETPGLGDKIDKKKSGFSLQFNGMDPATADISVKKDGGEIDAITASTISSRAFCDAVLNAYAAFKEIKKEESCNE